jgi:hypothetical protein
MHRILDLIFRGHLPVDLWMHALRYRKPQQFQYDQASFEFCNHDLAYTRFWISTPSLYPKPRSGCIFEISCERTMIIQNSVQAPAFAPAFLAPAS